jgi:hypothetical protein
MNKNIGYALISRSCSVGDTVILCRSGGRKVQARLVDMPFL